jgi:hypothetical protein
MRYLIALLCLFALPAFAASTAYFSALPDLPLAPNLNEEAGSAVRFDQPEGRIIILQATGKSQAPEINGFYYKTLPALGWKQQDGNRYTRDRESLTWDVKPMGNGQNRLNVLVKPQ